MDNMTNIKTQTYVVNGEEIILSEKEYDYLSSLLSPKTIEDGFDHLNITDKIIALFTICKYSEAWELIEENITDIDYDKIKRSPYFMINPNAAKVFKYLHDNSVINDEEYAYYDILSRSLNPEFWTPYIKSKGCKNFTDVCILVHNTYNGLPNDSIPVINLGEYGATIMKEYLTDEDKLDEFVYDKPAFIFPINVLYDLIDSGHFNNNDKIYFIISQLLSDASADYTDDDWYTFWSKFKNRGFDLIDTHSFIIDNDIVLFEYLKYLSDKPTPVVDHNDFKLLVNSKETPFFIHTINDILSKSHFIDRNNEAVPSVTLNDIKISDYLDDSKMALVISYGLLGLDISDYETIKFVSESSFAVYNKKSNNILFGENIYDATEFKNLKMWNEFIDDPNYQYHERSEFEDSIYRKFNNDQVIYNEFMYAVCDLVSKID